MAHTLAQTIGPEVIKALVRALAHYIITHDLQKTYSDELPKLLSNGFRIEQTTAADESMLVVIHAKRMTNHILSLLPVAIEEQEVNLALS